MNAKIFRNGGRWGIFSRDEHTYRPGFQAGTRSPVLSPFVPAKTNHRSNVNAKCAAPTTTHSFRNIIPETAILPPFCTGFFLYVRNGLWNLLVSHVMSWLDDVFALSRSVEEHLKILGSVLYLCKQHHLWLNPGKCEFLLHVPAGADES